MQYYYLISGLDDLQREGARRDFDAPAIRDYVRGQLGAQDREAFDLFYTWYDVDNLVNVRRGSERFNELGILSTEELSWGLREPELLPGFLATVVEAGAQHEGAESAGAFARALWEAFYAHAALSDNRFVREWFDFDRTLRNACAAAAARGMKRQVDDAMVGGDQAVESLTRSGGAEVGTDVEFAAELSQILALDEPMQRERRLDELRTRRAEQIAAFDYFGMDSVLAYMVNVNRIHRWSVLDPVLGAATLDRMLEKMKI